MRHTPSILVRTAMVAGIVALLAACDDEAPTEAPWVRTEITQPSDGAVITDSTVRIMAAVTRNCGCLAQAEFWIDGTHVFTDFLADYTFDWDVRGLTGEHMVVVRGMVTGKAEGSDTVRVRIQR